jgi:hypothetical protein
MGFLDKAKQMAEQAQTKLDEVQKQFNESQGGSPASQAPPVEYDQHGRPVRSEAPPAPAAPPPPHGDPVTPEAASTPPPASAPTPDPAAPPPEGAEDDRNHPSYAPPKMTSGDPLSG